MEKGLTSKEEDWGKPLWLGDRYEKGTNVIIPQNKLLT